MIEKIGENEGKIIGFKIIGNVTKADYKVMIPEIESILSKEESVSVLMDISQFKGEDMDALRDHFKMFHDYHKKIDKIAVIGNKSWEEWITKFAESVYLQSKFFYQSDMDSAWKWLKE
jgi:hypothetical protein